jgi:hypothetical protein
MREGCSYGVWRAANLTRKDDTETIASDHLGRSLLQLSTIYLSPSKIEDWDRRDAVLHQAIRIRLTSLITEFV